MTSSNLENLNLTNDELKRFTTAFKNDEFKKLFAEYCSEITDPENRKRYETELIQLEAQRGIQLKFITPQPGYVIKSSVNGKQKVFINVAKSENVARPSSRTMYNQETGEKGLNWSIPYTQSPTVKIDLDNKRAECQVYDVVFHPDTLHLADKNKRFKDLVTETACSAIEKTFPNIKLDMVNLKFPKLAFKGIVRPTVVREKLENFTENSSSDNVDNYDNFISQILPPLPDELKNQKQQQPQQHQHHQNHQEQRKPMENYAKPIYQIVQRRDIDFIEMTNDLDAKLNLTVPKELVITIDLPLINSTDSVQLDVTSRKLFLISEHPSKYKLDIELPYTVNETQGSAKFDKNVHKLIITLPVSSEKTIKFINFNREDSGIECDSVIKDNNSNTSLSTPSSPSSLSSNNDDLDDDICITGEITDLTGINEKCRNKLIEEITPKMSTTINVPLPDVNHDSESLIINNTSEQQVQNNFKLKNRFLDEFNNYQLPSFTCNTLDNIIAFTLNVKNTVPNSIVVNSGTDFVHVKFSSIGTGYCPMNYAFYCKFPPNNCNIEEVTAEAWDNNVILQITFDKINFNKYSVGLEPSNDTDEVSDGNSQTNTMLIEYHLKIDVEHLKSSDKDESDTLVKPSNIEVHSISEQEIEIKITNVNVEIDKSGNSNVQLLHEDHQQQKLKKNKRKNKKIRSFSESSCHDFKIAENRNKMIESSDDDNVVAGTTTKSIDIIDTKNMCQQQQKEQNNLSPLDNVMTRSLSECSDDQIQHKVREFKSILKRSSSYNRSISECSMDDQHHFGHLGCSVDFSIGSIEGIPEEDTGRHIEMSESCKKTVRFDNAIKKQLFRINSTIVGQRKPKTNRRKKKKSRGYSESEASDYDSKDNNKPLTIVKKESSTIVGHQKEKQILSTDKLSFQHDSGIDLSDTFISPNVANGTTDRDCQRKKIISDIRTPINILNKKSCQNGKNVDDICGDDLIFKSGMIFDIEI